MDNQPTQKQTEEFTQSDLKLLLGFIAFFLWGVCAGAPLSRLLIEDGVWGEKFLRFLVGFGGGIGFAYWLLYSAKGPGLDGLSRAGKFIAGPILRTPEKTRMMAVLPIFAAATVYLLATLGWLVFSDEASQKRALFNSWDRVSDIQWFHHNDSIDLYVYSETLDTLFKDFVPAEDEQRAAGVHITYSGDLMELSGSDFRDMVRSDIRAARVGEAEKVTGKAEIGIYETNMNAFSFVSYHGMFGITGHGYLEIMMMLILLVAIAVHLLAGRTRSFHLMGFALVFFVLSSTPSAMTSMERTPTELHILIEHTPEL